MKSISELNHDLAVSIERFNFVLKNLYECASVKYDFTKRVAEIHVNGWLKQSFIFTEIEDAGEWAGRERGFWDYIADLVLMLNREKIEAERSQNQS